ncbi:MAG: hypothetical protein K8U57_35890 [Planctomycetes bacterium]|nr:hypothetical protein [Planctomycetota bacterium]
MTRKYDIGETYIINHSRKGIFGLKVTGQDGEWLHGVVAGGTAKAMLGYNFREAGEEITVRKSQIRSAANG